MFVTAMPGGIHSHGGQAHQIQSGLLNHNGAGGAKGQTLGEMLLPRPLL